MSPARISWSLWSLLAWHPSESVAGDGAGPAEDDCRMAGIGHDLASLTVKYRNRPDEAGIHWGKHSPTAARRLPGEVYRPILRCTIRRLSSGRERPLHRRGSTTNRMQHSTSSRLQHPR